MMIKAFLTLSLFLLPIHIASAQEGAKSLLSQYITQNTDYVAQINLKTQQIFKLTYPKCDEIPQMQRLKPFVTDTIQFNPPQNIRERDENKPVEVYNVKTMHPSYGQWIEKTIVKGCDETTQINFFVSSFSRYKSPLIHPQLNGQTRIDIKFQASAEDIVKNEIANQGQCASNQFVVSTGFIGYRNDSTNEISKEDKKAGWFEKWSVLACDKTYFINLAVLPDPKTRYRFIAKLSE